jgi:hypothetical protein
MTKTKSQRHSLKENNSQKTKSSECKTFAGSKTPQALMKHKNSDNEIIEKIIKESYAKGDYRIRYKQAEDMLRDLMLKSLIVGKQQAKKDFKKMIDELIIIHPNVSIQNMAINSNLEMIKKMLDEGAK